MAILAVLQQALVFALAMPVEATPLSGQPGFELAAICGAHLPDGDQNHHDHGYPVTDCQFCPLCQALLSAGLAAAPVQTALPVPVRIVLYRLDDANDIVLSNSIALAAQPRGPPLVSSQV